MNPVKQYKHFIFDFDGVISDSYELAVEKFNEIRDELFTQIPKIEKKSDMTIVYAGNLRTSLNKWIGQDGTTIFFKHHAKRMEEGANKVHLFEGVVKILNSMGRKNVSIVTSSYSTAVKDILSKDISFDEDVIFKIIGKEFNKTKTEKINDLLNELRLNKEDVVYVGDLESDILYCRDVPIDIISVGYGYHPSEYLQSFKPTYFANSVYELEILLDKMKLATYC